MAIAPVHAYVRRFNAAAFDTHIPALQTSGVRVIFDEPEALSQPRPWLLPWLEGDAEQRDQRD